MRIDDLTRLQTAAELLNFVITLEMSGGVATRGGVQRVELFTKNTRNHFASINSSRVQSGRERESRGMAKTPTPMTIAKFNLSDQKNCERSFVQHVFSK